MDQLEATTRFVTSFLTKLSIDVIEPLQKQIFLSNLTIETLRISRPDLAQYIDAERDRVAQGSVFQAYVQQQGDEREKFLQRLVEPFLTGFQRTLEATKNPRPN